VRWPGKVKPGSVTAQHAVTMDWVPTFLEAAGVSPDRNFPLDGKSLLQVIQKQKTFKRDLYWKMLYRDQKALRSGDWKYLSVEGDEFLFNLASDERERANWAKRAPRRFDELRAKYRAWEESLPVYPDAAYSVPATRADMVTPAS
jgi:arylsulfatase A-like enzyme